MLLPGLLFAIITKMVISHNGIWRLDETFNRRQTLHLQRIGNGQLFSFGYHFVGIISPPDDVAALLIVALAASLNRQDSRPMVFAIRTVILTSAAVLFFKYSIDRPQPMGAHPSEGSYPSGHTASIFIFGAAIVQILTRPGSRSRLAGSAIVAALTLAVGFFLIYGRAHWISDVLASLCLAPLVIAAVRRVGSDPSPRS